ncbi:hypothetical protein OMO38_09070 [Chryseobacterium sp. 09-1422]|uniref:MAM domain-containing protein n=1 Tax=Chryseobacterium kimseyorum TaxID=2984028 RepID=A0ABT3HXZ2_9FLAO|nr:hypothetical protein [Chryseobacterium kimseyorum]MCW3168679.1 hypothetical protein [Chryseobacterium kimseyorum]
MPAFYERNFSFTANGYYEVSFWMYVVNPTTQTRLSIKDPVSGVELGGVSTGSIGSQSANWQEYKLNFRAPAGTCFNTVAKLSLQNVFPGGSGNDYYIDDIKVTRLTATPTATDFTFVCPTNSVAVDTDGDGIPDYADLDDDNDGILDTAENFCETEGTPYAYSDTFGTGTATAVTRLML